MPSSREKDFLIGNKWKVRAYYAARTIEAQMNYLTSSSNADLERAPTAWFAI